MTDQTSDQSMLKPSAWLGIFVGWLAQLGLKTILPLVVLVAIRMWSLEGDDKALWLEDPEDSSHPVWYALQASIFLGSIVAGALAGRLSPSRSIAVPLVLVILSLLATFFEQFPRHSDPVALTIWSLGPCIGLLTGVFLLWALKGRHT
jgi:hypothetical protein